MKSAVAVPPANIFLEIGHTRVTHNEPKRITSYEQKWKAKAGGLLTKSLEEQVAILKSELPYTKAYCERRSLLGSGRSDEDSSSGSSEAETVIAKENGPFAWLFSESKDDWRLNSHYFTPSLACQQPYGEAPKPTRWSISSATDAEECKVEWDKNDGHVIVRGFGPLPAHQDPPSPRRRSIGQSQRLMDLQRKEEEARIQKAQRETATAEKVAALQVHNLRKMEAKKIRQRRELQREIRTRAIEKSRQASTMRLSHSHLARHNTQRSAKPDDKDGAIASSSEDEDDVVTVIAYKGTTAAESEASSAIS